MQNLDFCRCETSVSVFARHFRYREFGTRTVVLASIYCHIRQLFVALGLQRHGDEFFVADENRVSPRWNRLNCLCLYFICRYWFVASADELVVAKVAYIDIARIAIILIHCHWKRDRQLEWRISSPLAPRVLSRRLGKLCLRPHHQGRPKCLFSTTRTGNSSGSDNSSS